MSENRARVGTYAAASVVLLMGGAVYLSTTPGGGFGIGQTGPLGLIRQFFDFDRAEFWSFFAALFAIMNPLIAVPLFVRVTRRREAASRRRLAFICTATVLVALIASALFGQQLLDFFAIGIGSFRIAGGVIVLLMGLAMLRSESGDNGAGGPGEDTSGEDGDSLAICPMAIPLLAGPGAIATMILQSQAAAAPADYGMIACVIAAMAGLTYLALRSAVPIARSLGPTGLMVTTRLIGMVVAAIAIDMMVAGLRLSFPGML